MLVVGALPTGIKISDFTLLKTKHQTYMQLLPDSPIIIASEGRLATPFVINNHLSAVNFPQGEKVIFFLTIT